MSGESALQRSEQGGPARRSRLVVFVLKYYLVPKKVLDFNLVPVRHTLGCNVAFKASRGWYVWRARGGHKILTQRLASQEAAERWAEDWLRSQEAHHRLTGELPKGVWAF